MVIDAEVSMCDDAPVVNFMYRKKAGKFFLFDAIAKTERKA
jgi:hypothetical protein